MHRDRRVAVGIEVGSGKTTVALIDYYGRVIQRSHAKTLRGRPASATLDPYVRAIDDLLTAARADGLTICGMSVSIPGTLDAAQRRPLNVSLLPSLNGFPLCDYLETRYHLPAQLLVDVDAAILGEHRFGVGKGFQRLLFLTVNAVVGASLVVDGQLERSEQGYMGHVCHLPVAASGPRCSCGKRGCINTLVSTDAMQKMVQRALRRAVAGGGGGAWRQRCAADLQRAWSLAGKRYYKVYWPFRAGDAYSQRCRPWCERSIVGAPAQRAR